MNTSSSSLRTIATSLLAFVFALVSTTLWAGPWSRATGEAVELQRTTKDLRNRMSRLYEPIPATQMAVVMDEMARQLIDMTKQPVPTHVLQSQLDEFDHLYHDLRFGIGSEAALASDRNVARYSAEIGRRFDRLVADLGRATPPSPVYTERLPTAVSPVLPPVQIQINGQPLGSRAAGAVNRIVGRPVLPVEAPVTAPLPVAPATPEQGPALLEQAPSRLPRISL